MSSSIQDRRSPMRHMRLRNLVGKHHGASSRRTDDDDGSNEDDAERPEHRYALAEMRAQIEQAERIEREQARSHLDAPQDGATSPRSPGGGAWTTSYHTREPHPLVNEVFPEPRHIAAFAEALRIDLGQQDVVAPQLLLADDHSGLRSPRRGMSSPREDSRDSFGSGGASRSSSLMGSLWRRFSMSKDTPANGSSSRESPHTPSSPLDKDAPSQPGTSAQANVGGSLNYNLKDRTALVAEPEPTSGPSLTRTSHPRNVGRISAASDFAPVNERVQRRSRTKRRRVDTGGREGLLYSLLRFPLLLLIFLLIAVEFALYVIVRQLVNIVEYAIAFRGRKGQLRKQLRAARTWEEWKTAAIELDNYLGLQRWKEEDASGLYDWILVKKVVASLRTHRSKGDAEKVMEVLELCLKNNFAGVENFKLFSHTYFGSKNLVERFATEAEESLRFLQETDKVSLEDKRSFYRRVAKNMGKSALCLSGGGSFGYYHVGVVRALLDANLLPNIVSGTSAGGLIAALTCTRTNEELKELLVPALADRITACEEPLRVWAVRAYKTGARFDTVAWASKAAFFTRGSTTFLEAYRRTGKVLNVSVIPSDRHSPVMLLSHLTAPHCIIWSALLASAAVPGLLNPVCLMQKTKDGEAIPFNLGHRFKDGSLRVDIPLEELHALFQVNYPIVSQVNPHIHLFHFAPQGTPGRPVAHRRGKGWRGGFVLSAIEHVLKLQLATNFKIIRDLDLLPRLLGTDWSSVFLQRFTGAVTIIPKTRFWDWIRILSDPDRKELARMLRSAQSATFPKLHMIENRVRLENAVEEGRRACRRAARARQQQQQLQQDGSGASAVATPTEMPGRPALNTLPSYLGSDTDHDDVVVSLSRKRSGRGNGSGVRSRLHEVHSLSDARDEGRLESGSEERHGSGSERRRRRIGDAGAAAAGLVTDEDVGTSEDGDHKTAGDGGDRQRRPTWLDRGDVLLSDEEEEEEDEGDGQGNGYDGRAENVSHRHRSYSETGSRGRTWSFARASAAFRNTFSPTKNDGASVTEAASSTGRRNDKNGADGQGDGSSPVPGPVAEEETSSGEEEP